MKLGGAWLDVAVPPRARAYMLGSRRAQAAVIVLSVWLLAAVASTLLGDASGSVPATLRGAGATAITVTSVLVLAVPVGWALGLVAGAGPRIADTLLARLIEFGGLWPTVVLLAVVRAAEPVPSFTSFVLVVALTRALRVARLVRGEALRVSHATHVMAARATGVSWRRLLVLHVSPSTLGPLLVATAFTAAATIALEAALSLIGLGVPERWASWGSQLGASTATAAIAPATAIAAVTGAFVLLADALDDALNPRRSVRGPRPAHLPATFNAHCVNLISLEAGAVLDHARLHERRRGVEEETDADNFIAGRAAGGLGSGGSHPVQQHGWLCRRFARHVLLGYRRCRQSGRDF